MKVHQPAPPPATPWSRGEQITTTGGVQVITDGVGRSTTIIDNGRVVTITTLSDGSASVTVNGHLSTDPRVMHDAIRRLATTSSGGRLGGMIRVNGRALTTRDLLAGGVAAGAFTGVIVTIVVMTVLRALARLGRRPARPAVDGDTTPRLERIEQAVESIAIEVERVSEAQRYTARLLTERLPEASPALSRRTPERVATPH